jgi:hypothetical protein
MLLMPRERAFESYLEWRDWLRAVGVCACCGMALGLWLVERTGKAPSFPLPCRRPKWKQGTCLEMVRAAWATRPTERKAA